MFQVLIGVYLLVAQFSPSMPAAYTYWPEPRPTYGRLETAYINIGALPCDGIRELEIPNPYVYPIYIRKVRHWIGTTINSYLDVGGDLFYTSNQSPYYWVPMPEVQQIVANPTDHYGNPNLPHVIDTNFAPDYVEILPGGVWTIRAACNQVGPQSPASHHQAMWIYFVSVRPKG